MSCRESVRWARVAALSGIFLGAAVALAAGTLAAGAAITSLQFAPGWQDHVQPLFRRGNMSRAPWNEVWIVSPMAPPGRYVVLRRVGDRAEVVPGHEFTVSRDPNAQIRLLMPTGSGDLEALPVADLPAAAAPASMPPSGPR